MKMQQLKDIAQRQWLSLHRWKGDLTVSPKSFGMQVKELFGDRRYKSTWVRAVATFQAQRIYESCIDSTLLITHTLNFKEEDELYEYRHEILDAFLSYRNGLELIQQGLQSLYSNTTTPNSASNYGIFELLAQREEVRKQFTSAA